MLRALIVSKTVVSRSTDAAVCLQFTASSYAAARVRHVVFLLVYAFLHVHTQNS